MMPMFNLLKVIYSVRISRSSISVFENISRDQGLRAFFPNYPNGLNALQRTSLEIFINFEMSDFS